MGRLYRGLGAFSPGCQVRSSVPLMLDMTSPGPFCRKCVETELRTWHPSQHVPNSPISASTALRIASSLTAAFIAL